MILEGIVYKDKKFYISEIYSLDCITQGHSKIDAVYMAIDWIESMLNKKIKYDLHVYENEKFKIETNDPDVQELAKKRQQENIEDILKDN